MQTEMSSADVETTNYLAITSRALGGPRRADLARRQTPGGGPQVEGPRPRAGARPDRRAHGHDVMLGEEARVAALAQVVTERAVGPCRRVRGLAAVQEAADRGDLAQVGVVGVSFL